MGLEVRVLADSKLVEKYVNVSKEKLQMVDNNLAERVKVTTNPYYPAPKISRKVADVPFSVIIFDKKEIGIEIMNSYNPEKFNYALLIRDQTVTSEFVKYFETLWERSKEDLPID